LYTLRKKLEKWRAWKNRDKVLLNVPISLNLYFYNFIVLLYDSDLGNATHNVFLQRTDGCYENGYLFRMINLKKLVTTTTPLGPVTKAMDTNREPTPSLKSLLL